MLQFRAMSTHEAAVQTAARGHTGRAMLGRMKQTMRITLDLDEDVLLAARELARRQRVSLGKALSELARHALERQESEVARNGVPLFPRQPEAQVVTLELVYQLHDEAP